MKLLTTIKQLKHAVDAGHVVKSGPSYTVVKDKRLGTYFIEYDHSDYCIGLHGLPGTVYETKLNGSDFYIKGES